MARIIDAPLTHDPSGAACDPRASNGVTVHGTWGRLDGAARRGLAYTAGVKAETDALYEKVAHVVPPVEWPAYAPLIAAINRMKKQKNAVVLAHNYMTSEIFFCVGDFRGDSLQLAREAAETDAQIIVQAGVHFMAETSKILAPEKTVLIPDMRAGCSLAASITGADVRLIKQNYPGLPIVTYVNTSAEVKAESDVTCTSSNAAQVVEWAAKEWNSDRVIMIPDEFLAKNVAAQTGIKIIAWHGRCEVHERFTAEDVAELRAAHPGVVVLAHPECPPDVMAAADFAGSTVGAGELCRDETAAQSRAADRMLDERQRRRRRAECRFRAAVQSLPAHEAHHAGRHLRRARQHGARSYDSRRRARARQSSRSTACSLCRSRISRSALKRVWRRLRLKSFSALLPLDGGGVASNASDGGGVIVPPKLQNPCGAQRLSPPQSALRADSSPIEGEPGAVLV